MSATSPGRASSVGAPAPGSALHLAGAPAIPGLRFRTWLGEADLPALASVRNEAWAADGYDEWVTPEALGSELAMMTGLQPARDLVVVECDGRVVGWSLRSRWTEEETGDLVLALRGHLLPEARRRRIGTALLHHNEAALRADPAVPRPGGRRLFDSWAEVGMLGTTALLQREDYAPARWFLTLVRPTLDAIDEAALPQPLEVRPVATTDEAMAVLRAFDEAFRDHWGYTPEGEDEQRARLADPRQDPSMWQVAYDGDEIAGAVSTLVDATDNARHGRARGWLDTVAVRRPWRRKGVARALIARALIVLRKHGLTSAALDVDADNRTGALHLYEESGFARDREIAVYRRPVDADAPPDREDA
jgi:ribosomal protein S18 acetylase RimI-like enzyme